MEHRNDSGAGGLGGWVDVELKWSAVFVSKGCWMSSGVVESVGCAYLNGVILFCRGYFVNIEAGSAAFRLPRPYVCDHETDPPGELYGCVVVLSVCVLLPCGQLSSSLTIRICSYRRWSCNITPWC